LKRSWRRGEEEKMQERGEQQSERGEQQRGWERE